MLNLLPPDEKKKIGRERLRRFIVAGSLGSALILAGGTALMLPAWLTLFFERQDSERILALVKKAPLAGEIDVIESGLKDFNRKLSLYEQTEKNSRPVREPIEKILEKVPAAISVRNVFYEGASQTNPERISLGGRAQTRSRLLAFVKALEGSGEFKKVHSPISNLLKESDLEFSLVLDLK